MQLMCYVLAHHFLGNIQMQNFQSELKAVADMAVAEVD